MGIGTNWINLTYWGISGLKFQCEKGNDRLDLEPKTPEIYERITYIVLPIYNGCKYFPPDPFNSNLETA